MAPRSTPTRNAGRALTWLGILIIALVAALLGGIMWGGATALPKLALDLQGGTQIVLAAQVEGGEAVSDDQMSQAVSIIRQRVDASGVSEAQVTTQGGNNIVVAIPGKADKETRDRIESTAKLTFRPVLQAGEPSNEFVGKDGDSTPYPSPGTDVPSEPSAEPTDASDPNWISEHLKQEYKAFDCDADRADSASAPADEPVIACDADGTVKYILGPVEVEGANISDASAGMKQTQSGASTGEWVVNLEFDSTGAKSFAKTTKRLTGLDSPRNQFAVVLDGEVITAPRSMAVITDGKSQISGSFTEDSAKSLADQLKYGALPINFTVQSSDQISATLGSSQLEVGLITGLIGLLLVAVYTLLQYRVLGFVTIFSLVIAGVFTYLIIALLSWREGYRLSLSGIAGLIVAIGFTADSFIVYFERIRDELRDGRGLESAVEAGWKRAKRTIYSAKGINLLAAVVLYVLAVGSVRGFAFTLGVTTVIDVLVVVIFTHPMLQLMARIPFFANGHPLSGLDPNALGAVYRGRAQFRKPVAKRSKIASSSREAQKRQTIAERKQAELDAKQSAKNDGKES